ncbi:hypothetical protein DPMN_049760 [Dreissena polymorpha]|uniref:EIF-4F 25 kDa subunit n=1 Tax=Dreissena polymorpha TaxID=45954 RepID=A0A9D4CFH3_DREPO|nr:hypothetical protein DPMN_049760 [Dreissena polymorpha]
MARQRPTRVPQVDIDQVNWCRNEKVIQGAPGLVMGPCIVEIDRIVIREVQYQFEVNRCRNEEIIIKAVLGGCCLCGWGAPGLVMGPCIVEIDPNVIREVQYQFEVNPRRNEKNIVNGNFWWVWPMWAGRPRIDPNVIREVQYQFEVNPCRKEKKYSKWKFVMGVAYIDRIVIREVQYQFEVNRCRNKEFQGSSANSVGGDIGKDERTDGQTDGQTDGGDHHNIPTFFQKYNYGFWYSRKSQGNKSASYDAILKLIGTFASVEQFWRHYCRIARPSDLTGNTDYHLFKEGIRPTWEDKENKNGGKWIIRLKKGLASRCWENLIMAMLGDQFMAGEEICGAVISIRYVEDILSL